MKMKLYRQKIELLAGDKRFTNDDKEGFEIDFDIPFSDDKEPDISEVILYNLSNSTIAEIRDKKHLILNAGYGIDIGNILTGNIADIKTHWEDLDKVTTIYVKDGPIRVQDVNKAYKKGTNSTFIINDLISQLDLPVGEVKPAKVITYTQGKVVTGSPYQSLKQVVEDTNSRLFIDKGKVYVRKATAGTKTAIVLNSESGLIGSPMETTEEVDGKQIVKYNVKCLLNHEISTDTILKIESKTINGMYKVEKGSHKGDFITECVVIPN